MRRARSTGSLPGVAVDAKPSTPASGNIPTTAASISTVSSQTASSGLVRKGSSTSVSVAARTSASAAYSSSSHDGATIVATAQLPPVSKRQKHPQSASQTVGGSSPTTQGAGSGASSQPRTSSRLLGSSGVTASPPLPLLSAAGIGSASPPAVTSSSATAATNSSSTMAAVSTSTTLSHGSKSSTFNSAVPPLAPKASTKSGIKLPPPPPLLQALPPVSAGTSRPTGQPLAATPISSNSGPATVAPLKPQLPPSSLFPPPVTSLSSSSSALPAPSSTLKSTAKGSISPVTKASSTATASSGNMHSKSASAVAKGSTASSAGGVSSTSSSTLLTAGKKVQAHFALSQEGKGASSASPSGAAGAGALSALPKAVSRSVTPPSLFERRDDKLVTSAPSQEPGNASAVEAERQSTPIHGFDAGVAPNNNSLVHPEGSAGDHSMASIVRDETAAVIAEPLAAAGLEKAKAAAKGMKPLAANAIGLASGKKSTTSTTVGGGGGGGGDAGGGLGGEAGIAPYFSGPRVFSAVLAGIKATKSQAGVRTWLRVTKEGDVDKVEESRSGILRLFGVAARDLRTLDPQLNYPSSLMVRERALVVNVERVRALIAWDIAYLLLDQNHPEETEELATRLAYSLQLHHQQQQQGMQVDTLDAFEFRALETILDTACLRMDERVTDLRMETYAALEALTTKVTTSALERVRRAKSRLVRAEASAQALRDEIESLLNDDADMAQVYLTRRKEKADAAAAAALAMSSSVRGSESSFSIASTQDLVRVHERGGRSDHFLNSSKRKMRPYWGSSNFGERERSLVSGTMGGGGGGGMLDVEDLENMLEVFFGQVDASFAVLRALREYIDDAEDFVNTDLDYRRNQLIKLELLITSGSFCASVKYVIHGYFGMNIPEPHGWYDGAAGSLPFYIMIGGATGFFCITFICLLLYFRHRRLMCY